jgi:hypothetical protein
MTIARQRIGKHRFKAEPERNNSLLANGSGKHVSWKRKNRITRTVRVGDPYSGSLEVSSVRKNSIIRHP